MADSPAGNSQPGREQEYEGLLARDWFGERPSRALAEEFSKAAPTSAVTQCPGLVVYLGRAGLQHGDDLANEVGEKGMIERLKKTGKLDELYKAYIFSIALPTVNNAGNEALVEVAVASGMTAGTGSIHFLRRRTDGNWVQVGSLHIWIG